MLESAHKFRRVTRLAVVAAASAFVAACDPAPTAPPPAPPPRSLTPSTAPRDSSLTCRSGYIIVDGRMVCGD